jgi:hypothetical protein
VRGLRARQESDHSLMLQTGGRRFTLTTGFPAAAECSGNLRVSSDLWGNAVLGPSKVCLFSLAGEAYARVFKSWHGVGR